MFSGNHVAYCCIPIAIYIPSLYDKFLFALLHSNSGTYMYMTLEDTNSLVRFYQSYIASAMHHVHNMKGKASVTTPLELRSMGERVDKVFGERSTTHKAASSIPYMLFIYRLYSVSSIFY